MNLTEGQKINMLSPPIGEGTVTVVFPIGKVCIFETNTKEELYIPAEGWIQDEEFTSQWLCGEYKISAGKAKEAPIDWEAVQLLP